MDFVCSDERITKLGYANPGSVLFDLVILKQDPEVLAARYKAAGVTTIYAHEECGAARAAFGVADAPWDTVNAWAQEETKKFCDTYGFDYGYISAAELVPQGHTHPGTTLFVSNNPEHRGGYRVSPVLAVNPEASVNALLTLVAFKPENGGDVLRSAGQKFIVFVEDPNVSTLSIDQSVQAFVEVREMR